MAHRNNFASGDEIAKKLSEIYNVEGLQSFQINGSIADTVTVKLEFYATEEQAAKLVGKE